MNNQRGGIISTIFIVPVGVALMAGFFLLGYSVGKYQGRASVREELAPPLPDLAARDDRKPEEYTFYKTLTDKNDRMASVNVKPRPATEDRGTGKPQSEAGAPKSEPAPAAPNAKPQPANREKEPPAQANQRQKAQRQLQEPVGKKPAQASAGARGRYTVQTASYQEKTMAEQEAKRLKNRGYAAFVASLELPGKGVRYRVRLGAFADRTAAEKLQKTLREKEGIASPMIVGE